MNKANFIAVLADQLEFIKAMANRSLAAPIAMTEVFTFNEKLILLDLDTLCVKKRAAHTGRNPSTGQISEAIVPFVHIIPTINAPVNATPSAKAGKKTSAGKK